MAKAVLYEKNEGRETLRLKRVFKKGRGVAFLWYIPYGVITAVMILFLVILGEYYINSEDVYLFERGPAFVAAMAAFVVVFALLYALINYSYEKRCYENVRSSTREYDLNTKRIDELEMMDEEDTES